MSAVMLKGLTLSGQIACVRRELTKRRSGYPRLVASRRMKHGEAEYEIQAMEAIQRTLEWLAKNEDAVRGRVQAAGGEPL